MNYNFHASLEAKAQRLLNALEPGTVLPVHRHSHTAETYLLLRGKIRVMFYNEAKEETAFLRKRARIGYDGKCIHLKMVVIMET